MPVSHCTYACIMYMMLYLRTLSPVHHSNFIGCFLDTVKIKLVVADTCYEDIGSCGSANVCDRSCKSRSRYPTSTGSCSYRCYKPECDTGGYYACECKYPC